MFDGRAFAEVLGILPRHNFYQFSMTLLRKPSDLPTTPS